MKTTTRRTLLSVTALLVAISVAGCGVMRPVRGRREAPIHTGFLGDYSQLAEREGYKAQEVYVDPAVDWTAYRAVYIDSVTLWSNPDMKLDDKDQQMLTDMLYT